MELRLAPEMIVLDRFRLRRSLGEGGMGVVWEAEPLDGSAAVALKFLKRVEDHALRRFRREARAAMAVEHPNVRRVLDLLELPGGEPVLLMEYLEGESLGQRLGRLGRLGLSELSPIAAGVAAALAAAHAAGIVHRDLKPENIFILGGEKGGAKVLDFGIAKLLPGADSGLSTQLTESGSLLGTPCYMSPEQAFEAGEVDYRTDVWSFGIVLYEALSGVLPTRGETLGQVFRFLATGQIRPLEELVVGLPPSVTSLIARMLARSPEDRPQRMQEIASVFLGETTLPCDAPEAASTGSPSPVAPAGETLDERLESGARGDQSTLRAATLSPAIRRRPLRVTPWIIALGLPAFGALWWMRSEPERPPATSPEDATAASSSAIEMLQQAPPADVDTPPPTVSAAPQPTTVGPTATAPPRRQGPPRTAASGALSAAPTSAPPSAVPTAAGLPPNELGF